MEGGVGYIVTRDMETPEHIARVARSYLAGKFEVDADTKRPEQQVPLKTGEIVFGYAQHRKFPMLYLGLDETGAPIPGFQYCEVCMKWLSTGKGGSQNAERHCRNLHWRSLPEWQRNPIIRAPVYSETWDKILFFVRNLIPIKLVDDPIFRTLGTQAQLWRILTAIGADVDLRLKKLISEMTDCVLIEDGWTDGVQRPYEGLWLSGNLSDRYRSLCIGHLPLNRADATTLASAILQRLEELGITGEHLVEGRIRFFVGDMAPVNRATVGKLNEQTGAEVQAIPCSAHALNNVMQLIWSSVRQRIAPLLAVIEYVRNKGQFRRMSEDYYKEEIRDASEGRKTEGKQRSTFKGTVPNPIRHGFPTTIATAISVRWYSLVRMLETAIQLRPVIEKYMKLDRSKNLASALVAGYRGVLNDMEADPDDVDRVSDQEIQMIFFEREERERDSQGRIRLVPKISDDQWKTASDLLQMFGGFQDVMCDLEMDGFGTIAEIWRCFMWLRNLQIKLNLSWLSKGWKEGMTYWGKFEDDYPVLPTINQCECVSRMLRQRAERCNADERERLELKAQQIQEMLPIPMFQVAAVLRPSNLTEIRDLLDSTHEWNELLARLEVVFNAEKEIMRNAKQGTDDSRECRPEGTRRWRFSRMGEAGHFREPNVLDGEWDRYLALRVGLTEDGDIGAWWKDHANEFPVFYRLAQKYLVIPATSAGVERMFSKARRVLSRLRLRLTQRHAELLVFLKENIEIVEQLRQQGKVYWSGQ